MSDQQQQQQHDPDGMNGAHWVGVGLPPGVSTKSSNITAVGRAAEQSAKGPGLRVLRTVVQVLIAVATAVPAALGAMAAAGVDIDPELAALITGVAGAAVVVVAAVWNAIDAARGKG